jgi:hypothetical protein
LNLSGTKIAVQTAATTAQPKLRARWIPSGTGTHMGGHYEDEPARGPSDGNIDNLSAEAWRRLQNIQPKTVSATGG